MDWYILDENKKPVKSDIFTVSYWLNKDNNRIVKKTDIR